jgi:hypothetical protein
MNKRTVLIYKLDATTNTNVVRKNVLMQEKELVAMHKLALQIN